MQTAENPSNFDPVMLLIKDSELWEQDPTYLRFVEVQCAAEEARYQANKKEEAQDGPNVSVQSQETTDI